MKQMIMPKLTLSLLLSSFLFITLSSFTQSPPSFQNGKEVFERKCITCHGKDGTKGFLGAKNLQRSTLSDAEMMTMITKGKRIMPSWEKKLTAQQISDVASYIKTLRK
jgi:mono/diheme cytochrome c family protein